MKQITPTVELVLELHNSFGTEVIFGHMKSGDALHFAFRSSQDEVPDTSTGCVPSCGVPLLNILCVVVHSTINLVIFLSF